MNEAAPRRIHMSRDAERWLAYERGIASGGEVVSTTAEGGQTTQTSATSDYTLASGYLPPDWMYLSGTHDHGGAVPSDGAHAHARDTAHKHNVSIPDHDHDINLPGHIHGIEYGIFENPDLPTSISVKVDGNIVEGMGLSENNIDIIPYLSKDENGKILRGIFHTVEIIPNNLARITAAIVKQIFVQSRGDEVV